MSSRVPPTDKERAWIAEHLASAAEMAKEYDGDASSPERPTLAGLDGLWEAWSAEIRETDGDPNPLINIVGIALGQYLVDTLGLAWVIATDEYGTDLAVHRAQNDVLIYPCNLVAKRWEAGATAFVAEVAASIVRDVRAL